LSTIQYGEQAGGSVRRSLGAFFEQRWLFFSFVEREITKSFKGSYLGIFWTVLEPLLLLTVYTIVFSGILRVRFVPDGTTANFGIYLFCGLLPWLAFAGGVTRSVRVVRSNSNLVKRVMFPLEMLPASTVVAALASQLFGLVALLVLVFVIDGELQWTLVLVPLLLVPQLLFTLGIGYIGAVIGAFVRDLQEAISALMRLWFFMTPIIYPLDKVPEQYRFLLELNPMTLLVYNYRRVVLEGNLPDWGDMLQFSIIGVVLAIIGFFIFRKMKKHFADVI
jgi:ABC-type polysaccharide/polyol phosphate export permease